MAHFAEIDENNIVTRVIVIHNDYESEGAEFCKQIAGGERWIQTSYNANFRKNFAGIGFTYDAEKDAFIPPKPEIGEWVLDEETCRWVEISQPS